MLTLFTTAKPFRGHSAIIQRNALKSWTRLYPAVEVILFGDDEGAAQIARELGLRHEAHVERNEFGTKRIDFLFSRAQQIAQYDILCYVNCDILLFPDFLDALKRVESRHRQFLMVGRRWDADMTEPLDPSAPGWDGEVRERARTRGVQRPAYSVDYFAFRRGLYAEMPVLVIGRIWWDHWLVWKARRVGAAVIDASSEVLAIHQNHDYAYHPGGAAGVWNDEQAQRNYAAAGGKWHLYTIDDATHILTADGERRNWKRYYAPYWRALRPSIIPGWHRVLDVTRPLRHRIGPRQKADT